LLQQTELGSAEEVGSFEDSYEAAQQSSFEKTK
jgi:hypothetical protein